MTKNEILTALNKLEEFVLELVQVPKSEEFKEGDAFRVAAAQGEYRVVDEAIIRYVWQPLQKEPDFGVTSVNYDWRELWERGNAPQ